MAAVLVVQEQEPTANTALPRSAQRRHRAQWAQAWQWPARARQADPGNRAQHTTTSTIRCLNGLALAWRPLVLRLSLRVLHRWVWVLVLALAWAALVCSAHQLGLQPQCLLRKQGRQFGLLLLASHRYRHNLQVRLYLLLRIPASPLQQWFLLQFLYQQQSAQAALSQPPHLRRPRSQDQRPALASVVAPSSLARVPTNNSRCFRPWPWALTRRRPCARLLPLTLVLAWA